MSKPWERDDVIRAAAYAAHLTLCERPWDECDYSSVYRSECFRVADAVLGEVGPMLIPQPVGWEVVGKTTVTAIETEHRLIENEGTVYMYDGKPLWFRENNGWHEVIGDE